MRNLMIAAGATFALAAGANAGVTNGVITLNVDGIGSFDGFGDADNVGGSIDVAALFGLPSGTAVSITSFAYDVTIATEGASWRSEARVFFDSNPIDGAAGLNLAPGAADGSPGTSSYSTGGFVDMSDNGIPNILLPDGILTFEFYESYDDVADTADAFWSGTIQLGTDVPTPGALAVAGVAGLAAMRRRRA